MKAKTLWQVALSVAGEEEALAGETLERHFGQSPCVYADQRTGALTVSVYLDQPPDKAKLSRLAGELRLLSLAEPAPQLSVKRLGARDWVKTWQEQIKPLRVGRALLVRPSWDATPPRPGQQVVVLDPGLSFGTGHHPTTLYCLKQIVRLRGHGGRDLLDVGTGSGLLAIAAARLGYRRVAAFDYDPDAVRVARHNARLNGVLRQIRFYQADVTADAVEAGRDFAVVCANLTEELLIQAAARLAAWVRPGGWLVVAGILAPAFASVRRAFEKCGLVMRHCQTAGDWTGGAFQRPVLAAR